jgi:GNAT superfamily N-acetyltransferase
MATEETGRMLIRTMTDHDFERVAVLAGELGYPVVHEVLAERVAALTGGDTEVIYVAELDGDVVGWIHLREFYDILEEPTMEIRGLVVDARCRGEGIGQRLVEAGETRARERGIRRMRVTSNVVRERAHRFYERLDYARVKTSYYMVKRLAPTAE